MGAVHKPIFSMFLLTVKPGVPVSTTNALMPQLPFSGAVEAKTSAKSATGALVTKVLVPLSR